MGSGESKGPVRPTPDFVLNASYNSHVVRAGVVERDLQGSLRGLLKYNDDFKHQARHMSSNTTVGVLMETARKDGNSNLIYNNCQDTVNKVLNNSFYPSNQR
ncbi:4684_t:CDS:2 [Diversispora eburnea]|uniref:4684_t:CDS:1 n=1 Tax=Diversispora eburnea TaxID=1213867 RepID=A0A9N8VEA2_9GLOM|nr:4684_t:CDS:2 [Diversispora eburnea]